jgi:hypothetical protein
VWGSKTSVRVGDLGRSRTVIVAGTAGSALVLASFLYKSIIRFAQLVILRFRADVDKEVEILVLRHGSCEKPRSLMITFASKGTIMTTNILLATDKTF